MISNLYSTVAALGFGFMNTAVITLKPLSVGNSNTIDTQQGAADAAPGAALGAITGQYSDSTLVPPAGFVIASGILKVGSTALVAGDYDIPIKEVNARATNDGLITTFKLHVGAPAGQFALQSLDFGNGNIITVYDDASANDILASINGTTDGSTLSLFPNDGRLTIQDAAIDRVLKGATAITAGDVQFRLNESIVKNGTTYSKDNFFVLRVLQRQVGVLVAEPVGEKTRSGIVVARLAAGASIFGTNAAHFAVDSAGQVSVSSLGQGSLSGTYSFTVIGDPNTNTLTIPVEAGWFYDVTSWTTWMAALTADAAVAGAATRDTTFRPRAGTVITPGKDDATGVEPAYAADTGWGVPTRNGVMSNPNFNCENNDNLVSNAIASITGGSVKLAARAQGNCKIDNRLLPRGKGPWAFENIDFTMVQPFSLLIPTPTNHQSFGGKHLNENGGTGYAVGETWTWTVAGVQVRGAITAVDSDGTITAASITYPLKKENPVEWARVNDAVGDPIIIENAASASGDGIHTAAGHGVTEKNTTTGADKVDGNGNPILLPSGQIWLYRFSREAGAPNDSSAVPQLYSKYGAGAGRISLFVLATDEKDYATYPVFYMRGCRDGSEFAKPGQLGLARSTVLVKHCAHGIIEDGEYSGFTAGPSINMGGDFHVRRCFLHNLCGDVHQAYLTAMVPTVNVPASFALRMYVHDNVYCGFDLSGRYSSRHADIWQEGVQANRVDGFSYLHRNICVAAPVRASIASTQGRYQGESSFSFGGDLSYNVIFVNSENGIGSGTTFPVGDSRRTRIRRNLVANPQVPEPGDTNTGVASIPVGGIVLAGRENGPLMQNNIASAITDKTLPLVTPVITAPGTGYAVGDEIYYMQGNGSPGGKARVTQVGAQNGITAIEILSQFANSAANITVRSKQNGVAYGNGILSASGPLTPAVASGSALIVLKANGAAPVISYGGVHYKVGDKYIFYGVTGIASGEVSQVDAKTGEIKAITVIQPYTDTTDVTIRQVNGIYSPGGGINGVISIPRGPYLRNVPQDDGDFVLSHGGIASRVGNKVLSPFTPNTGAGTSWPENFAGPFRDFTAKYGWQFDFRTDTYEHCKGDITAIFTPKAGSLADGCGPFAAANIVTLDAAQGDTLAARWASLPDGTIAILAGTHAGTTITGKNTKGITLRQMAGAKVGKTVFDGASNWKIEGVRFQAANLTTNEQIDGQSSIDTNGSVVFVKANCTGIDFDKADFSCADDTSAWTDDDWRIKPLLVGLLTQCPNSKVTGCTFNNVKNAVYLNGDNQVFDGNTITNFGVDAIRFRGNDIAITNNLIRDSRHTPKQSATLHGDAMQGYGDMSNDGTAKSSFARISIIGNTVIQGPYATMPIQGISSFDGLWTDLIIRNNIIECSSFHGIAWYGVDGLEISGNTVRRTPDAETAVSAANRATPWILVTSSKHVEGMRPPKRTKVFNNTMPDFKMFAPGAYLCAFKGGRDYTQMNFVIDPPPNGKPRATATALIETVNSVPGVIKRVVRGNTAVGDYLTPPNFTATGDGTGAAFVSQVCSPDYYKDENGNVQVYNNKKPDGSLWGIPINFTDPF